MTNLNAVNFGLNQYCGPSVLSALTGESTDRCAAVISKVSGKREIKAVDRNHLREALKLLRFDVEDVGHSGRTLYGALFTLRSFRGLYVVFVPHHVIAVEVRDEQIYICDNHSKTPIEIKQSARLMQKVEAVWRVSPKESPIFIRTEIYTLKTKNKIEITAHNIYKNTDDNTKMYKGAVHFDSQKELNAILAELKEYEVKDE